MKKNNKLGNCLVGLVGFSCVIIYLLIVLINLREGLFFWFWPIMFAVATLIFIFIKFGKKIIAYIREHRKTFKIIGIVLIVLGFMLRLMFLCFQGEIYTNSLKSDTGVHWNGAQQIVDEGSLGQDIGEYEAVFPYLTSYTGLLAIAMMIFGKGYFAVVFLNILFDVICCVALFILFSKWKKRKSVGLLAVVIWALNPLEIIFCSLPLAIVVTNTFVIISVLLIYLVFCHRSSLVKLAGTSMITGIVLACGNFFRPIFIVFLLAILVHWFIISLDEKQYKGAVLSCGVLIGGYLVTGLLSGPIYSAFNPYYDGEKSEAGWSFYLGANYDTRGEWNIEDRDDFFGDYFEEANNDIHAAHGIAMEKGLERYGALIAEGRIFNHLMNKMTVLFGDVQGSIYDVNYYLHVSKEGKNYRILQDSVMTFYVLLLLTLGYCIINITRRKNKYERWKGSFMLFLMILIIGLLSASLLVEVMNRYSLPFITLMIIIALGLVFSDDTQKRKDMI